MYETCLHLDFIFLLRFGKNGTLFISGKSNEIISIFRTCLLPFTAGYFSSFTHQHRKIRMHKINLK